MTQYRSAIKTKKDQLQSLKLLIQNLRVIAMTKTILGQTIQDEGKNYGKEKI